MASPSGLHWAQLVDGENFVVRAGGESNRVLVRIVHHEFEDGQALAEFIATALNRRDQQGRDARTRDHRLMAGTGDG